MESLEDFDGRGRPDVVVVVVVEGKERREDSVEVKAWLVGVVRELGLDWP